MMMIYLVKKDILIVKKYILPTLILAVGIPIFMGIRLPQYASILGFMLSAIFSEFMVCQYVSLAECKYAKATALLCSAPYSKSSMVLSKYVLFAVIFIFCTLVYTVETLLFSVVGAFNLTNILLTLFITSVFYGIYMPIQYKFEYEKTKYLTMVILMSSSFILPFVIANGKKNIHFLAGIPVVFVNLGLLAICIIMLLFSILISINIFKNKDLV